MSCDPKEAKELKLLVANLLEQNQQLLKENEELQKCLNSSPKAADK